MKKIVALAALLALGLACRRDTADAHVMKADSYVEQKRYPEAIIEYRNALQLDPKRGDVRSKLGQAYAQVKEPGNAVREYVRAADLLPNDVKAQIRAGVGLMLARAFEDAKGRADKALEIDPTNVDALILRGNALAGLKDFEGAIAEYQDAVAQDPNRDDAYLNLASIELSQGGQETAEASFKKAVESAPDSVYARVSLANFYWSTGRLNEAEQAFKATLERNPRNISVNQALGVFYMMTRRAKEAEPYFRTTARTASTPSAKLTLAEYYLVVNRTDEARRVLEDAATNEDAYAKATVRLASLDAARGQRAEAGARVANVLARYPTDVPALVLSGNLLWLDGKRDEARTRIDQALAADPNAITARLWSARMYAGTDRLDEAIAEYNEVLKRDRRSLGANLEIAHLYLKRHATDKALGFIREAQAVQPGMAAVHALLAQTYILQNELTAAKTEVALLQKALPKQPIGFNLAGQIAVAEKRLDDARKAYATALQLNPEDLDAFTGLVGVDFTAGRPKDAIARIEAVQPRVKATGEFLTVAARSYAAAGDFAKAEALFNQAIAADPSRLQAYEFLGRFYAEQHRIEDAKKQFETILARDPKSLAASTMLAMLLHSQGRLEEAEKVYQQALSIDPRAAIAANNLADIYATSDRNLDIALQLAQTASSQMPDDPTFSDTVGWIYYKRKAYAQAIEALSRSVTKDPNRADTQYHLGMAYFGAGDIDRAREHLDRALKIARDFPGAAEAEKTLRDIGA